MNENKVHFKINFKNMSDKIGRVLLYISIVSTIVLIIVSSIKLLDSNVYRNKYQFDIEYYKNYYISTETLLDSLDIECDNSIFNTKVGRDYLIHKNKVDSIFYNFTNGEPFGIKEE